jgi:murein DD-endopeptidase MepM/ murein hydrolase activator NlpD
VNKPIHFPEAVRPLFDWQIFNVSQKFGDVNSFEPEGYLWPDGSIGYQRALGLPLDHFHNGVDYAVKLGSPILAPVGGKVELVGISPSGFGLRLGIGHYRWICILAHLSTIDVKVGDTVHPGRIVASSGGGNGDERDGNSTGPHLHWSMLFQSGRYYDPAWFVFGHPDIPES